MSHCSLLLEELLLLPMLFGFFRFSYHPGTPYVPFFYMSESVSVNQINVVEQKKPRGVGGDIIDISECAYIDPFMFFGTIFK